MRRFLLLLVLAFAAAVSHASEAAPLAEDPAVEQRLIAISEEMRCLVCQNESLSGSRSELAQDLRRELRTLIRQGRSDAEIRDFMVARYGDFVLYRPRVTPMTWALWFGPFVLMGAAVAVLFVFLRQRNGALSAQQAPMSEEEMKQVEAMLKGRQE